MNSSFSNNLPSWAKIIIIYYSSDCVFDGELGSYNEKSLTTANDVYGRTKALGEINY